MEYRHFSHTHGLEFHQLQHGSEIQCSACKTSASANVYVCWRCNYFLHEHCFNATRSLKTASHPLHPLTLMPYPTHQSSSFYCNSCNLIGTGLSYCCAACDFDLHVHCANLSYNQPPNNLLTPNFNPPQNYHFQGYPNLTPSAPGYDYPTTSPPIANPPPVQPNSTLPIYTPPISSINVAAPAPPPQPTPPLPTQTSSDKPKPPALIKHFSHPHVLLPMEIDKKNPKVCSACECFLSGSAYCCTEGSCTFNLHKACFDSPMEVRHKCHLDHPLKLLTAPPYKDGFTCNACLKKGKAFAYHCDECAYDLHIDCATWPDSVTRPDHKHDLKLYYSTQAAAGSNQEAVFVCDVCKNPAHELAWVYYCRECDYGTHLECVVAGLLPAADAEQTEEDLLRETQLKFAVLQLLLSGGLSGAGN